MITSDPGDACWEGVVRAGGGVHSGEDSRPRFRAVTGHVTSGEAGSFPAPQFFPLHAEDQYCYLEGLPGDLTEI